MKFVRIMSLTLLIIPSLSFLILSSRICSQDISVSTKSRQWQEPLKKGKTPKVIIQTEDEFRDSIQYETYNENNLGELKRTMGMQKIVRIKVKIKSNNDAKIIKQISLEPAAGNHISGGGNEVIYIATVAQLNQLKRKGIEFEVEKEGIRIEKSKKFKEDSIESDSVKKPSGTAYGENGSNYSIPQGSWIYSPITINSAPAGAVVSYINVHYEIIHTYIGDLVIDLTDENLDVEYSLWNYEGGSGDNINQTAYLITNFDGEPVNQTWKLWGYDCCYLDSGYIDYWWINIMYSDPPSEPDLIVKNLTASDYNPMVGNCIDVTLEIKNQGTDTSFWFLNGLFYNLSSPPSISTLEDEWFSVISLAPGYTESYTFPNITSADTGIWHMYGLADCDSDVVEICETNNYKGPVDIHWRPAPEPDLVIQSLTVDNSSPVITEHTNGTITIKNQSSDPIYEIFYTDVFKNSISEPSPPVTGEYYWPDGPLLPEMTETHYFYKLPTCFEQNTNWSMWGLVDSWPYSWGNIQESDEDNNAYGPINIKWCSPPPPQYITRDQIIENAEEFTNVRWHCSIFNVTPHWACSTWYCDFKSDSFYTGMAYSWGGWDKPDDYLTYIYAGLCAGSYSSNNCGAIDAYWATGTDCSGLVSRCWELGSRQTTSTLDNFSHQIPIENLRRGDIMLIPGHVRLFVGWTDWTQSRMLMIESTPRQACTLSYSRTSIINDGYLPYEYDYILAPPDIPGDANSDGILDLADVIYIANYYFGKGPPPEPEWKGDVNGDCHINIGDPVYLAKYLFSGGPAPWCNPDCPDWNCES